MKNKIDHVSKKTSNLMDTPASATLRVVFLQPMRTFLDRHLEVSIGLKKKNRVLGFFGGSVSHALTGITHPTSPISHHSFP